MRFHLRTLLIVLALLALMASGVRPATMPEEKGLNGRWKVVIAMQGGKPVKDAVGEFAVFIDDRFAEDDQRGRLTAKGKVSIDWSKTPATIDVRFDASDAIRDENYEIDFPPGEVNLRKAH